MDHTPGIPREAVPPLSLEEYKLIKEENLRSIQAQQSTLTFGLAAVFLGISAWAQMWAQEILVCALGFVIIPALCLTVLRIWLGEVLRMARASYYLWEFERALNAHVSPGAYTNAYDNDGMLRLDLPLRWETWVRGSNPWRKVATMSSNYHVIVDFLLFIPACTILLTDLQLAERIMSGVSTLTIAAAIVAVAWTVTISVFAIRERRRVLRLLHLFRSPPNPRQCELRT